MLTESHRGAPPRSCTEKNFAACTGEVSCNSLLCFWFYFCFAVVLWLTMIVSSMCIYGSIPLFFEVVCESTYPIAEGVTNGFLTWLNNVVGLVFLLVVMIPMGEFSDVRPTELPGCFYSLQKYFVWFEAPIALFYQRGHQLKVSSWGHGPSAPTVHHWLPSTFVSMLCRHHMDELVSLWCCSGVYTSLWSVQGAIWKTGYWPAWNWQALHKGHAWPTTEWRRQCAKYLWCWPTDSVKFSYRLYLYSLHYIIGVGTGGGGKGGAHAPTFQRGGAEGALHPRPHFGLTHVSKSRQDPSSFVHTIP